MICQVALLPVRGLELATSGSATQASVTWAMADLRQGQLSHINKKNDET